MPATVHVDAPTVVLGRGAHVTDPAVTATAHAATPAVGDPGVHVMAPTAVPVDVSDPSDIDPVLAFENALT